MRLVVLADTHVRDGASKGLPDDVWRAVDRADGVLHAGAVVAHRVVLLPTG